MSLGFKHDPLNFLLSGAPTITELPVVSSAGRSKWSACKSKYYFNSIKVLQVILMNSFTKAVKLNDLNLNINLPRV